MRNNMQQQLQQIRQNPQEFIKQAGWDIPPEMVGNPQQMVMHLIQTNQVSGPMVNMIMPMIRNMK